MSHSHWRLFSIWRNCCDSHWTYDCSWDSLLMCQVSLIWSAGESCFSTKTWEWWFTAFHSKWRDQLNVLIKLILKGGTEDNVWVIELRWWAEDKTGIGGTETENEDDCLSDIVAMAIWVSGSGNFFSEKMVRKLYIDLSQCLLAEPTVLFSVNFVALTASSFSTF